MSIKQKTQNGFTLIELLLVVSIISLLSSVFLASLQGARSKAGLAAVKQQADSIRKEAEIYFTTTGYYSTVTQINTDCPYVNDPSWGFIGSDKGIQLINNLKKVAGNVGAECAISENSWAISLGTVSLASNNNLINVAHAEGTGFVCFDSSGNFISVISGEGVDGSDGDFRSDRIVKTQFTEKFVCNQS